MIKHSDMKKLLAIFPRYVFLAIISMLPALAITAQPAGRSTDNFNFGWKFHKGDVPDGHKAGLDDSGWRQIDLPHDWSIEGPFSKDNASCTGYLPGGIGWYRKTFVVPDFERSRNVFIYFDGIYNNSEVWINGNYLGKRPNGYISFQYDLTPYIKFGKENLLAVRVDHSLFRDSRWYTGSGIYRDVKLTTTEPVHIGQWGVFCTTPSVTPEKAILSAEITVVNERNHPAKLKVISRLMYNNKVAGSSVTKVTFSSAGEKIVSQVIEVNNPELWDVEAPHLYSLVTEVHGRELLDNVVTKVGFRTLKFDPDKGFFLNGRNLKLKGICMHHDAGTLGAAVPRQVLERRLDILKDLGCNAIRTSHNPFSTDFMELCDEKGFLVIGEAFDEWELPKKKWIEGWNRGTPGKEGYAAYFKDWAIKDLRDFVMRDRNHPSLIMWSIGNEVDYPNDPYTHPVLNTEANPQTWAKYDEKLPHAGRLGEVARELAAVIRKLDPARAVTAGLASALMSNETGYAEALDVAGYNYQEFRYASDHARYPDRPLYGSENGMSLDAWKSVTDNDYVMGQFLWTGIEYLGEAGQYPVRHSTSGLIDLAGNRKPEFFFRQSLWSDKPMVFLGTTDRVASRQPESLWAHKRVDPVWNYNEGQMISVNAFTNCEEVELYLNGKSLGIKKLSDFQNRTISWDVPFEKGTLKAVARNGGKETAVSVLNTTGEAVRIDATADRQWLRPGKQDVAHIFVTLNDENGNTVYTAQNEITCEIEGPVRILGMEDANPSNTEDYKDNRQHAFHGKLLIYLQSLDDSGNALIRLTSPGLKEAVLKLEVRDEK